jgi:hypothetical protein
MLSIPCKNSTIVGAIKTILAMLLVSVVPLPKIGSNASAQSKNDPSNSASDLVSVERYGTDHKDCMEWTDSCVSCLCSEPPGAIACFNIGITCQASQVECKRHKAN